METSCGGSKVEIDDFGEKAANPLLFVNASLPTNALPPHIH